MQEPADAPPPGILEMIAEGYTAPRESIARILWLRPDIQTLLAMVGFNAICERLGFAVLAGEGAGFAGVVWGVVVALFAALLGFAVLGWLIGTLARAFGGEAPPGTGFVVMAWHAFITTPVSIVFLYAVYVDGTSQTVGLLVVLASILWFVLLAAYITRAYGFDSMAKVAGIMLGMMMLLGFVLSLFMQMPAPA